MRCGTPPGPDVGMVRASEDTERCAASLDAVSRTRQAVARGVVPAGRLSFTVCTNALRVSRSGVKATVGRVRRSASGDRIAGGACIARPRSLAAGHALGIHARLRKRCDRRRARCGAGKKVLTVDARPVGGAGTAVSGIGRPVTVSDTVEASADRS